VLCKCRLQAGFEHSAPPRDYNKETGRDMTDMQAAGTAAPVRTFPERHYNLFLREDVSRFFWKLRNQGITLSGDRLHWDYDGRPRERSFDDLREVRLQFAHVHKSGDAGLCQLTFNDGLQLIVQSTNASGLADDERAPVYRDFIRDLNKRLAQHPSSYHIDFQTGDPPGRRTFGVIISIVAILFFGGLPLGLFLFFPGWDTLGVLGAGAAFVWPLWKTMQRNEPRSYSPSDVPHDLLP
jgi:hypothetical protein